MCLSAGWGLQAGSDPAPPWSLFIPSSPPPVERNPLKKGTTYLCIQFNHRQMFVWASNGFSFFFSFIFNFRFAGLSSPVQSRTISVWLKPLLVGGMSLLPRATSLMQKNTSSRCFVRCFYIKQFSSVISVCQWEIKCIYFPVCFREEFFAHCGGFSHMAVDGHGCWNPHGRAGMAGRASEQ